MRTKDLGYFLAVIKFLDVVYEYRCAYSIADYVMIVGEYVAALICDKHSEP